MKKVTFFFRPPMKNVFSIETVFDILQNEISKTYTISSYYCTNKWKRFYSYFKSISVTSDINHITGDIHTITLFLRGSKTILTIHDVGALERGDGGKTKQGLHKFLFRKLWFDWPLARVKYITTISEFTKARILENTKNISPEKIQVIHNPAADDFKYSDKDFNCEKPLILQVGSGEQKNLYRLIEAVKNTSFRLLLVRKPDPTIEKLLIDNNIEYIWHSNISRSELYDCYCQSDIVYFASEYEGFGVPILEANAVGRPVITSTVASMPEVAGDSAILVDPFDVDQIKMALNNLRNNVELRSQLIQNGAENLKRFDKELIAAKYVELYKQID